MKAHKNKSELTSEEHHVMHEGGTEPPFSGKYWNHHQDGSYVCKSCGQKLFHSDTKLDSSRGPNGLQGWPAFDNALPGSLVYREDISLGMHRTEVVCSNCGVHLGHLFKDNETKTGDHFCINSCTLNFTDE
jgi:peptide-methionine (R)-S-oxide reductase